uniref:Uncharacterized protein n=1 Tax=Chromera velia CCMP2878 TaxID=1169474 RepID=A0A0G4GFF5_9ALVE|eukprot:Cvel_21653.t1-p1 / transcript=Cvel_21653.t1 / gene=Cvel_21653 / organism=Chromera_velia_CCMP2878 / gene_product=Sodium- and chloride-dependent neutral and basic, putative / transcript_product=Sodium- and chloride-dependent neutral and basic, putative / location=Cvel_scaffold2048:18263-20559(-) / protein_length=398 / sequence_SO=supercontig / SO=protein_coding / is_pseudo=false
MTRLTSVSESERPEEGSEDGAIEGLARIASNSDGNSADAFLQMRSERSEEASRPGSDTSSAADSVNTSEETDQRSGGTSAILNGNAVRGGLGGFFPTPPGTLVTPNAGSTQSGSRSPLPTSNAEFSAPPSSDLSNSAAPHSPHSTGVPSNLQPIPIESGSLCSSERGEGKGGEGESQDSSPVTPDQRKVPSGVLVQARDSGARSVEEVPTAGARDGGAGPAGEDGGEVGEDRQPFNNQTGIFWILVSYAVGLGNLWWFPSFLFSNGGAAALVPYCLIHFCLGIPLFATDLGIGQRSGKGSTAFWRTQSASLFKSVGPACSVLSFGVGIWYAPVIAYSLYYIFEGPAESLTSAETSFRRDVLHVSEGANDLGMPQGFLVAALAVCWVVVFVALSLDVRW